MILYDKNLSNRLDFLNGNVPNTLHKFILLFFVYTNNIYLPTAEYYRSFVLGLFIGVLNIAAVFSSHSSPARHSYKIIGLS